MKLSRKQILDFNKLGYLVLDNVFSNRELQELKSSIKNILLIEMSKLKTNEKKQSRVKDSTNIFSSAPVKIANSSNSNLTSLADTISESIQFKRIVTSKKIQLIVNRLLMKKKDNPLYGYINRCRINLAKDSKAELGWHREIFQTIPRSSFIQIWAPLIHNTNKKNGSLQIIPRSHVQILPKPKWASNKNLVSKVFYSSDILRNFNAKDISLKLGQAIFFSGRLLHKSGQNNSNNPRYSVVGLYHNISDENFIPPKASFSYRGETPKEYFDSFHKKL